jgi:hypothetical protein
MKVYAVLGLAMMQLLASGSSRAVAGPIPGTPLGGGSFGQVDIVDGLNLLPGLVVPGDVVLNENPLLNQQDRTNWSDVVRYFNIQTAYAGTVGVAYQISDGENGTPRIDILDANLNAILPDVLNANNQFINELQVGTGTEADITQYVTPGATYNIHSDAASPELAESFPAAPGQPLKVIGVGKPWFLIPLIEGRAGPDMDVVTVRTALLVGTVPVVDNPLGGPDPDGGGVSDTITLAVNAGNPAFTDITLTSIAGGGAEISSPLSDLEFATAIGDEGGASFLIEGTDVPEPATLVLLGTTMAGLFASGRLRIAGGGVRKPTAGAGKGKSRKVTR